MKEVTAKAMWCKTQYDFPYTGSPQTFTTDCDGYYRLEVWGASGTPNTKYSPPGVGGYSAGDIQLVKNETLHVYVGQDGSFTNQAMHDTWSFNGGGPGLSNGSLTGQNDKGGGGSDFRLVDGSWDNINSLTSRIIVAGGGGGGGSAWVVYYGGSAGGLISYFGNTSGGGSGAKRATQTDGYAFGKGLGGLAGPRYSSSGGGYWGGQGNTSGSQQSATITAGGSSYISGHTGSVAVVGLGNTAPKSGCTTGTTTNSCSVHYSGKYFTNTLMIDGLGHKWTTVAESGYTNMPNPNGGYYANGVGHTGNGYARATYLGTSN